MSTEVDALLALEEKEAIMSPVDQLLALEAGETAPVEDEEFGLGTMASDVGKQVFESAIDVNTGLLDMGARASMLPRAALEMGGSRIKEFFTGEDADYAGQDAIDELIARTGDIAGPELLRETITDPAREGARTYPQEIPEGAAGEGFERWRSGADIAGAYINPLTPLAGGLNAVRGVVGGVGGGLLGEEIGGETGKTAGMLIGDLTGTGLLRDPKSVLKGATAVKDFGGSMVRTITNTIKNLRGGGKDVKGMVDTATTGDLTQAVREMVNNISLPPEIARIKDPAQLAKATDEYLDMVLNQIKVASEAGELGSIAQITKNPGLIAYERHLGDLVEKGAASPEAVATHAQRQLMNLSIKDLVNTELSTIGKGEAKLAAEAARPGIAKTAAATRAAAEPPAAAAVTRGERAAAEAAEAGEKGLAKTTAAEKGRGAQWRKDAIQDAAPEGVTVTKTGQAAVEELKPAINKAYNEAWEGATSLPSNVSDKLSKRITSLSKTYGGDEGRILSKVQAEIQKLTQGVTPDKMKSLDNAFRRAEQAAANVSGELAQDIKAMREVFRAGVPAPVKAELAKIDAKYPKYLAVKDAALRAIADEGDFTAGQLASASKKINKTTLPYYEQFVAGTKAETAAKGAEKVATKQLTKAEAEARALRSAGVKEAKDLTSEAEKAAVAIEKSPAGKFSKADRVRVDDAVSTIIKGGPEKTPIKHVKNLVDSVADNPAGKEHVKRAFVENFQNSVGKKGDELTQDSLEAFKKMRPVYEESGLFTTKELDTFENAMVEGQKLYLTAPDVVAKLPKGQRKVAEVLSGLVGAKIGAFAFGSPLIGAAYGRKFASAQFEKVTRGRIDDLAYELATRPDKFADEITRLKGVGVTKQEFESIVSDMMKRIPAAGTAAAGVATGE